MDQGFRITYNLIELFKKFFISHHAPRRNNARSEMIELSCGSNVTEFNYNYSTCFEENNLTKIQITNDEILTAFPDQFNGSFEIISRIA